MEKLKPTIQDGPYVSPSVLPLLICRDVLSDELRCEVQQNEAAFTPSAPDRTRILPLERQSVKVSENIGGSCLFKVFLFFVCFVIINNQDYFEWKMINRIKYAND